METKILVNKLPQNCKECDYCAAAMMMTPLGVQKQIDLCTFQAQLIPPKEPNQPPNLLDVEKSPKENGCPFKAIDDNSTDEKVKNSSSSSTIILT